MESPYLERIRQLLPDLHITQVDVNSEGLVNEVVILNREIIVRFPKADWAREALQSAAALSRTRWESVSFIGDPFGCK